MKKKLKPIYRKFGRWSLSEIERVILKDRKLNGSFAKKKDRIINQFHYYYRNVYISFCELETYSAGTDARYRINYHRAYIWLPNDFFYYICREHFERQYKAGRKWDFEPTKIIRILYSNLLNSKWIPWLSRSFVVTETSDDYLKRSVATYINNTRYPNYGNFICLQIYRNYDHIVRSICDCKPTEPDLDLTIKLYMSKTINEIEKLFTLCVLLIDKTYEYMEAINNEEYKRNPRPFEIIGKRSSREPNKNTE